MNAYRPIEAAMTPGTKQPLHDAAVLDCCHCFQSNNKSAESMMMYKVMLPPRNPGFTQLIICKMRVRFLVEVCWCAGGCLFYKF